MSKSNQRVVLITGASSGIGRTCANYLHQKDYRVYGTSRQAHKEVIEASGEGQNPSRSFELIPMDVTVDASVERGIETVLSREGRLDVVVNNAGFGLAGAVEDTSLEEAQAQFETNFFGVLRICHAVLPSMRKQQAGYIVNVSSIGGLISIPFQGIYSASKFALEGLTEALRMEVQPYGIRVVLIEPGDFHTDFTTHRRKARATLQDSVYSERFVKSLGVMEEDETNGPTPERIAYLLERIINTSSPRLRYSVGPLYEKLAILLKKVLPSQYFEWAFMKYYKML